MASTDVEHTVGHGAGGHAEIVDTGWRREPADAPSARFGWHGAATKTFYGAAVFFAVFLVLMIIGNHTGHIEDLYLIGFAVAVLVLCVRGWWMNRGKWS
ncbi:DUF2631 domain-containing protein [Gordonia sp. 'Campus']|uniref:DUF2631 domain-containing protein n=1 Tax=Gordonia sp. 'Campus' TaxID=2915824 RepID=UPI001EE45DBE|nr:DUF2631 domain-containing protein [Gordonia sp. 'Campus']